MLNDQFYDIESAPDAPTYVSMAHILRTVPLSAVNNIPERFVAVTDEVEPTFNPFTHGSRYANAAPKEVDGIKYRPKEVYELGDVEKLVAADLYKEKYKTELTRWVEEVAVQRQYRSSFDVMVQANQPGPKQRDGIVFSKWFDECNALYDSLMTDAIAGTKEIPVDTNEFLKLFPTIAWPSLVGVYEVSMAQARKALVLAGINLSDIAAIFESLPEPQQSLAKIDWEFAGTVRRDNQLIGIVAGMKGWTDVEVDALFTTASTL